MNISEKEKLTAAYALNLCTVSIQQIIDYNDINIMQSEYDAIINNLNLEKMPKDNSLLEIIKQIMDEITFSLKENGDKKIIEKEYQYQMNNAIRAAIPKLGPIFATSDPIAMTFTFATQVGIGYMNYRRNKEKYNLNYEKSKWEIKKNRMAHLNGLQKQLFDTAWRLAEKYEFPDEYRLTEKQIKAYNKALLESNPIKRYNSLDSMRSFFNAYPSFWYQIGSTASSIYQSKEYLCHPEIQSKYHRLALECFLKYNELNDFNLLRHDIITSAWALDYIELLDLNQNNNPEKARELIETAAVHSDNQHDIIELCAFSSLRIKDHDAAIKYFARLVNKSYNCSVNTQLLSGLYIQKILSDKAEAEEFRIRYNELNYILKNEDKQFILPIPPEGTRLENWNPYWEKAKSYEETLRDLAEKKAKEHKKVEEAKKKAQLFYQKPITLVYRSSNLEIAEYMKGVIEECGDKIINPDLSFSVSLCEYEEYKRTYVDKENSGGRFILIGHSSIASRVLKNVDEEEVEDKYGIKYATNRNKSVIMVSWPKRSELEKLILLAREINKSYTIKIPENDVEDIDFSFLKEIYDGALDDTESFIAAVLGSIIGAPLLVIGQILEGALNIMKVGQNNVVKEKIKFFQYCVGLYLFLEHNHAIIDSNLIE